MSETKLSAFTSPDTDTRLPRTFVTTVRPHQLKRADVFTELFSGHSRRVMIEKVTHGEIEYRGRVTSVLFVYGVDLRNKDNVVYTRTGWEFLEVERAGDAPTYLRAKEPSYVY
jgi:hypothetical protein